MGDVQERRVCREMSPERAKACVIQPRKTKPTFKKVQVVYYLSRDGHLEHPHYMEVTHLAHQQLRLKDVMDRLTVLRGKRMPSLYSWSCKRSYKNGYVWNDLAENDVIYPSDGAEYVLKGSKLIEGCSEKMHHLQVGNVQLGSSQQAGEDSNLQPKRKSLASKRGNEAEEMVNNQYDDHGHEDEGNVEEDDEYEEKTSYTRSTTPYSRCSRGVSTDEIEEFKQRKNDGPSDLSLESNSFSSPPSATSSTISDRANNDTINYSYNNNTSKGFEDGDPAGYEPLMSRNSMLLSLIACGGSASFRKTVPPPFLKQSPPSVAARKSGSGGNLHKGVVCKAAAKVAVDEEEMMISSMSENPRFGNLQVEEKEYFSGSIVEAIATERIGVGPGLKKSSSHNEERSTVAGLGEAGDEEAQNEKGVKGKCIPRKKSSSKQSKK